MKAIALDLAASLHAYGAMTIDRAQSGTATYTPTVKKAGMNKQSNSQQASSTVEAKKSRLNITPGKSIIKYKRKYFWAILSLRRCLKNQTLIIFAIRFLSSMYLLSPKKLAKT